MEIIVSNVKTAMDETFSKYEIEHADAGLTKIAQTWYDNKYSILELFRTHPNWSEDNLCILLTKETKRVANLERAKAVVYKIARAWEEHSSVENSYDVFRTLALLREHITSDVVEEGVLAAVKDLISDFIAKTKYSHSIRVSVGMKWSRLLSKLFTIIDAKEALGNDTVDTVAGQKSVSRYERFFASASDSLNPIVTKRVITLSIHPCDYLNMSTGTDWHSCHALDGGGYRVGTMDYMLDNVTFILSEYRDTDKPPYWNKRKIRRQCYMYKDGNVITSRLYPNNNDEAKWEFSAMVKEAIATCLGEKNSWKKVAYGGDVDNYTEQGAHFHYPDYKYSCYKAELSRLSNYKHSNFVVGHECYDTITGDPLFDEDDGGSNENFWYTRKACPVCGETMIVGGCNNIDDTVRLPNGTYVHEQCVTYCQKCGRYHLECDVVDVRGTIVCKQCLESYYAKDEKTGEYFRKEELVFIKPRGIYVQRDFVREYISDTMAFCDHCGQILARCDVESCVSGSGGNKLNLCHKCEMTSWKWSDFGYSSKKTVEEPMLDERKV